MSAVEKFEDLKCWIASRELVTLVFSACSTGKPSGDFGTPNQFRRAALSVMNNIAEGVGRTSRKEFIRFLDIAQSSAIEVKSMTYVPEDLHYLNDDLIFTIRSKSQETKKIIRGLMHSLEHRT